MKSTSPETKVRRKSIHKQIDEIMKKSLEFSPSYNDDFFQLLAESSNDVIFYAKLKPKFHLVYVSPSCKRITGYTPEEHYADPELAINSIIEEDRHFMSDPSLWGDPNNYKTMEIRCRRKDGTMILMEHSVSIVRDKDGHPDAFHVVARDITERKKAEVAFKESQEFNATLLEYSPHATVVINADTSVRYVNPAWERINGWTAEEVVGIKCPNYPWWPEKFREEFAEPFKESMQQENGNSEFFAQKKNGEIYWIAMNWVSVKNNGQLAYMIINSVDITDRIKAQEALKESESKYRSIFESANDVIVLMDREGTVIDINNKVKEIGGFEREEIIGRKLSQLTHVMSPNSLDQAAKMFNQRITGDTIAPYEIQMRKKNGEPIYFEVNAVPLQINDKVTGNVAILRDITSQKRSMLALKESEEKFSKAFLVSPHPVCIVAIKDGTFLEVNESYLNFCGYSRDEVIGHTPNDLNLWVDKNEEEEMGKSLRETSKLNNLQIRSRMKSGEVRIGLFSAEPIEIGGVKCITIVITDITEQKKTEEALANEGIRRRILIEQSRDGIVIIDEDGKLQEANQRFAEMLGYSMDEVKQLSVTDWEFLHTKERTIEMVRVVNENGNHFESQHRRKDGTVFDVEISCNGTTFAGRKHVFCVCRDITERKRSENIIRESEERFRTIFETMAQGVIYHDSEGKIISANQAAQRILGLKLEELLGKTSLDPERKRLREDGTPLPNEEHPPVVALRTGTPVHNAIIALFNPVENDYRWIICDATPQFKDGDSKPCGVYTTFTDITERKRMEEALRESEVKFSKAFNNSPEMMIIVNIDEDRYMEVNDSFAKCLGYTREELVGHKVDEFNLWVNPEEKERMTQSMREHGKHRNEEFRFRTKTGEVRTWLCSADTINIGGTRCMLGTSTDITERIKTQEALRESEEKFAKAFQASPSSISICRISDSKFIEVNDSFLRDKGYTREEVIGHSSKEIIPVFNVEDNAKNIAASTRPLKFDRVETEYRTKSGEVKTGLMSAEIINIGNEPCALVINTDITQQKKAQEQLRLLSSVTQQITDSTIITDSDLNITYLNKAAEKMFGYTLEELKGKKLTCLNETQPTKQMEKAFFETLKTGNVYASIITKRRKDGTLLLCDCRLSPLVDEDGKIRSLIDVQRDITKEKEVEQKLQDHKKLIDSILATTPEAVLVIDKKQHIILANKALYKIFRLNRRSLKNNLFSDIFPKDEFDNLHNVIKRGAKEKTSLEFRYQIHNQEKIIYCVIVKMDNDRILLTFSDISREREEEEKIYLTSRLASIGEMAAGLAHELNNPLTGILTLSQLLAGSELPPECKEDIDCIYTEAKRAAGIVKNVLLFARNRIGDSGQSQPNEVIKDVFRLREYEQKSNNIKVVMNLEDNLPEIPLDKGQLQQVFLNLISNAEAAIKETKRPGTINVTTQRENNHVNIIFGDNGSGIKKQIIHRIFDPFFTTKEIGKGTGLGLSICYSIIVKHGGKINVASQVNEGATFTINMPIAM